MVAGKTRRRHRPFGASSGSCAGRSDRSVGTALGFWLATTVLALDSYTLDSLLSCTNPVRSRLASTSKNIQMAWGDEEASIIRRLSSQWQAVKSCEGDGTGGAQSTRFPALLLLTEASLQQKHHDCSVRCVTVIASCWNFTLVQDMSPAQTPHSMLTLIVEYQFEAFTGDTHSRGSSYACTPQLFMLLN